MAISDLQNLILNFKSLEKPKFLFKIPYIFCWKRTNKPEHMSEPKVLDKTHTKFHVDISISDDLRSGQVGIIQLWVNGENSNPCLYASNQAQLFQYQVFLGPFWWSRCNLWSVTWPFERSFKVIWGHEHFIGNNSWLDEGRGSQLVPLCSFSHHASSDMQHDLL